MARLLLGESATKLNGLTLHVLVGTFEGYVFETVMSILGLNQSENVYVLLPAAKKFVIVSEFVPKKATQLFVLPKRSIANVRFVCDPLNPFPLASLALPSNG